MVLSKLFSSSRSRDKENEKKCIIKGYPLTNSPVIPDILKHQVEFKKVKYGSTDLVGFTFAHEGSNLVQYESLKLFRKKLAYWYPDNAKFQKQINSEFTKNLIAISVSFFNFDVGESCHDFKLDKQFKPSENSFLTYRKHSECIQCAYYNENGVEYLAGITFYPAPHGKPKLLRSNNVLLAIASNSAIVYPHGDRRFQWSKTEKMKQYGRFCSTAGKHVLLKFSPDDGVPRHLGYNHVTNKFEKSFCIECLKEFYKWEEPKKDISATSATGIASAAAAVTYEDSVSVTVTSTDFESSAVSHANSTESLLDGFERIDVSSDVESDIDDAELID
ncbi:unnamed protein product [Caenorhabditis brenneri]